MAEAIRIGGEKVKLTQRFLQDAFERCFSRSIMAKLKLKGILKEHRILNPIQQKSVKSM